VPPGSARRTSAAIRTETSSAGATGGLTSSSPFRHQDLRQGTASEAFLLDDVELQMRCQLGEWAAPGADGNRDGGQLVLVHAPDGGQRLGEAGSAVDTHRPFVVASLQRRDLGAEIPAEDLDRSPLRVLQGA